ncbi:hypothetical protein PVAND_000696 [Polypedilum vanderplanki]|uniref:Ectopic P granules protein 5-like protein n=1 Tax=Polypedilum vanderplanki TaxID=319348 RepID=A0A9J6BLD3_POLVA|nr:hypothetical protein PVAND_000696 [Polypedilum vanderplanki]
MEIERPKSKSKKKERHQNSINEELMSSSIESLDNIDDLSELRKLCEENELKNAVSINVEAEIVEVSDLVEENNEKEKEEAIDLQVPTPSAPITQTKTIEKIHTASKFIYPDLSEFNQEEQSCEIVEKKIAALTMQPFAVEIMEQFYSNEEIRHIEIFENEFVDNELKDSNVDHYLYALLKKFSSARSDLLCNIKEIEGMMQRLEHHYEAIWKIENRIALSSGFCSCGKAVGSTHSYKTAIFCEQTYQKLEYSLKILQIQVCYNQAKLSHECTLYQHKIDQVIAEIMNAEAFKHINEQSPITLHDNIDNQEMKSKINDLRVYISILFKFLREASHDVMVEQNVKNWITQLISLQLRVAAWTDHIFILFHMLRCKDGFGTFGSSFIQIPILSIDKERSFQHCVAVLSTILMPIAKRIQFLEENLKDVIPALDASKHEKDLWIMVESDSEDLSSDDYSTLKENDLVAIFDQIPLDVIFKAITYANNQSDTIMIDFDKIKSGHHIIKSIAFASKLITIIKRGLFNLTERHKQFAKRLGKLLKDTLFFIKDLVQIYMKSETYKDPEEHSRIHVEFDELIIKSVWVIYDSKKFSLFQYLADFPYEQVSNVTCLWKLCYSLHVGELRNPNEDFYSTLPSDFFMKFNHYDIPIDDLIFLLHAFTKMALVKGKDDYDFLMFLVRELIYIGFVIESTRDFCYTTVKNSISDIASMYPKIIDDIFNIIKYNLHQIGAFNLHLLKSLPLYMWRPNQQEFYDKIRLWLLNFDFESLENITARLLIRSLNWNFDNENTGQLFLPHEFHISMAHLICEVYIKYVDETKDDSKLFGVISRKPTKMENISKWCWTTTSLLRLHQMDVDKIEFMRNPNILVTVPELEKLEMIYQGYTENNSLAIYMSVLISQLGHSLPQLCYYGFKHLAVLAGENRFLKVIECLELMTPLFVNCQDSLFSCENFIAILEIMTKSENELQDRFLKDLKTNFTIPNYFGFMIQNQMNSYQKYGWSSPSEIATLWVNCLIRMKNWNKDKGILYLLDLIAKSAYPYTNCWNTIKEIIRPQVSQIAVTKIAKTTGWLGLVMTGERDILLSPFNEFPTLSLIILECEHENIEVNTGAWDFLINQLAVETKKSFSNVFKNVLQSRELTSFPPRSLVVYKLADLICGCSMKEFIFPIICQQFFTLYLVRSSLVGVSNDLISSKISEVDVELFKKLKTKFQECESYHTEMTNKLSKDDRFHFHTISAQLYKTFLLWMDENQMNKFLHQRGVVLPPQYEVVKLTQIFERNRAHWTEFINLIDLRNIQKENCDHWLKIRLRFPLNHNQNFIRNLNDDYEETIEAIATKICERIKLNCKSHKPPPVFTRKPLLMGKIDFSKNTLQLFKTELKKIKSYARQFSLVMNEHKAVDATYLDCIKFAYKNEPTFKIKSVNCSRGLDDCSSSVTLRFEFNEMKVNEVVKTKLNDNREFKRKIVARELKDLNPKVTDSNFCLEIIIEQLFNAYRDESKREKTLEISTSILFELLDDLNEEIKECPVAYDFFSYSITKLGSFVQTQNSPQGVKMLKIVLKNPNTLNVFAKLFEPASTPPAIFIKLYECLVDFYIKNCEPQNVFLLLSKFDMPTWLELFEPKIVEVSELIQLIFKGLELYSLENSELLQDILKCHLVHLFLYHFPEHYGEILHTILQGFSQNRLRPCVLFDIINALYQRAGCRNINNETPVELVRDEIRAFAAKQNLLCYDDLHSTTLMLNHHFYNERLNGLHGIYPKYSVYCDSLAILFGTIGHGVVSAAIKSFSETTADELVNDLFTCLSRMYAPMLVPIFFSKNNMKNSTARPAMWIQQLTTESTVLQPWSNLQIENAEKFIKSFSQCLSYISDMLPASNSLIGNVFQWYIDNFAYTTTPNHVLLPIHKLLVKMPFERLLPTKAHMEGYNKILNIYLPDSHTFLGNVFLRINWTQWLSLQIEIGDVITLQRLLSILFMTLVKLSYEPKVRESIRILQLLKESIKYPWLLLEYKDVENVLDWIVMSAEPSIILNIPSEHESIDVSLLTLLQTASCMKLTQKEAEKYQQSVIVAKRMAYVRSIVRLLKACDAKLNQLISSKKGMQMFIDAVCSLLDLIQSCVQNRAIEATNLIVTITDNVLAQTSSENTLNLFANSIKSWQEKCQPGDTMLGSFLDALKVQTYWTIQAYQILESTLLNYFRKSDKVPSHTPNWIDVSERTGMQLQFSIQQLIDNDFYLTLHLLSYKKMLHLTNDNDRMEYLQELQTKLSLRKTTEMTESGQCLVWLLVISSYARIHKRSNIANNYLETIILHFQSNFSHSESWGEGLLNAVGLKKDNVTNSKRILLRCFTIAIQNILTKNEYEKSLNDLNNLLNQKKFADVKIKGLQAVALIEGNQSRMSDEIYDVLSKLIRIFYSDDFLVSIENLYTW